MLGGSTLNLDTGMEIYAKIPPKFSTYAIICKIYLEWEERECMLRKERPRNYDIVSRWIE